MKRARPHPLIMLVAIGFMSPPAWSIYQLLTEFGSVPAPVALFGAAGIDATIILFGYQALSNAEDGDASWPWNLGMMAFAGLSIAAQISHSVIAHEAIATGVVLAGLAIAGVCLIEGQLRRCYRINGRAAGRLPMARSRVSLEQWIHFRKAAQTATKIAISFPEYDAPSIFAAGLAVTEQQDQGKPGAARKSLGLTVNFPAITSGQHPDESAERPPSRPHLVPPPESMSALVRRLWDENNGDPDATFREVIGARPDANPESVRATIRKIRRSA